MRTSLISLPSAIIGAAVFVILFVVLSVTLWVSIVAGVAGFAIAAVAGGGVTTPKRSSHTRAHRA